MHRKHGIILKAVITVCSAAFLVTGCGKADSLYDKGMDYIKDKDYKQALECFDDAIAVNNEKAEYYIASGMAYNYLGKYQDAIKRFSKAFQSSENSISNTNNKQLYYGEAISYYGINDYDKVIADCKKALDIKQVDNLNNKYDSLKGTTAVMFCNVANAPAKLIKDKSKDGIPGLKAAYAEESFYVGADQLDALVAIKSKNEVIADIVALLQSPAKNVISALQSGGNTLHGVLKTLGER